MNERSVKINEMVWKNKIGGMDEKKKDEMRIKIDLEKQTFTRKGLNMSFV